MKHEINQILEKYKLADHISVIAVSGGADSVALLDLLTRVLGPDNLIVAHVNHGLRPESESEAALVRRLAEIYGLKYYQKSLKLVKADEETARSRRYRWLRQVAKKTGAKYIITAHHLNDQLETILLRLTRGVGPLDLWGMRELDSDILRPLLGVKRAEIEVYVRKYRLPYVDDASNKDLKYSRNRLRQLVVPEMEKLNPNLLSNVEREIKLGQEAADYFEGQLSRIERRLIQNGHVDLLGFKKQPIFIQREIIRRQLWRATGKKSDVYSKNIEAVIGLLDKPGQKETQLGGLRIVKNSKSLDFHFKEPKKMEPQKLTPGQIIEFGNFSLKARIGTAVATKNNILLPISFSDNLEVRSWRQGDKIQAQFGTKKIQDVFVDAKIDRSERKTWPVIVHKGRIVWVPRLISSREAGKEKNNLIIEVK